MKFKWDEPRFKEKPFDDGGPKQSIPTLKERLQSPRASYINDVIADLCEVVLILMENAERLEQINAIAAMATIATDRPNETR